MFIERNTKKEAQQEEEIEEEEEANIVTAYLRVGQKVTGIKCSLVINLARHAKMTS